MATYTKRGAYQWQAKVRRKGYPEVSKTFDTKAEAVKWSRVVESEMDRGVYISRTEAETTTLKEALRRYLNEITPSKKGAKQEGLRINAWMRHPLAKRNLATIRGADLAAYRDERQEDGMSPTTIRNELIIIGHLFNIAKKEWGMESLINPVQNIRMPKMPSGRDRRLEEGEEESLLGAADYPLKQMIVLALETGMRMGEMLTMRWENVDLVKGVIELSDTKNGEKRFVPLSTRAKETLKDAPRNIHGGVFPGLSNSAISHRFRKLCKELEIENLRFHDLRHEATSRLFEKNLDSMEVASITGHKTLHMLKRYTHLKAEDLAKKLG